MTNALALYGIDKTQHAAMLRRQDGRCAICDTAVATDIDHDHTTGDVRGLLCGQHNTGLGLFGDDPDLLRRAAAYLENPPGPVKGGHLCADPCPGKAALTVALGAGATALDLAAETGEDPSTVFGWLQEHHVPKRGRQHVCGLTTRCPGERVLRTTYEETGSLDGVAARLSVSRPAARAFMGVHGVEVRPQGRPGRGGHVCGRDNACPGEATLTTLLRDHALVDIGRQYGVSAAAVARWRGLHATVGQRLRIP